MAQPQQEVKKVSRVNIKKKVWVPVLAPVLFGQKVIGEAYLVKAQDAVGRKSTISLKELTGNVKDQSAQVTFRLSGVEGGKLTTTLLGYQLTASSVRRMVKKSVDRVDDYLVFTSKDRHRILIKPLLITVHTTKHSIHTHLRKRLKELLGPEIRKNDVATIFNNVVYQKLQQMLRKQLGKVYPLRDAAIRVLLIMPGTKGMESLPEQEAEQESSSEENSEEQKEVETGVETGEETGEESGPAKDLEERPVEA